MPAGSCRAFAAALALASCGPFGFGPQAPPFDELRQCNDGLDNDGNGHLDYPDDPGCESELDPQEAQVKTPRQCSDGVDNDGDGRTDFASAQHDTGCDSASDDDEFNVVLPACGDGVDNDRDGLTDFPADSQCSSRNDGDEGG
jgi:hypothetical protein